MDHLYLVCYDVRCDQRWRQLFKKMKGYGEWVQLSVFQCRLDKIRLLTFEDEIRQIINMHEDHVIIMDIGPVDSIKPKIKSLGRTFEAVEKRALIV
jgi:CRISPR-associated protein Cas2